MPKLLIVESPKKAKKIASYLGSEWTVKASMGHIRDLPKAAMGVEAPNFRPEYESTPEQKKVIGGLKAECTKASHVYLATDPDREGEAIAWHLQKALGLKDPHRVTFHSLDKASILRALNNPRRIDLNLVHAQEGRRVCDRLVGYTVSGELCQAARQKLSAGRVQSPALRLVVEREEEIRAFQSQPYYEVEIQLDMGLKMKLLPKSIRKDCERLMDRTLAEVIAQATEVEITKAETKPQQVYPKPAFTTSTLQQACSSTLKISAADTMKIAQMLFENGLITYHRTDNPNMSEEGYEAACEWLQANGLPCQRGQRRWEAKGNAQEAHEAIRPTDFALVAPQGEGTQQAVYKLIRERALRSQMPNGVDDVTVIEATDPRELNNDQDEAFHAVFAAKGRRIVEPGFRALNSAEAEEGGGEEEQEISAAPAHGAHHKLEHAQVLDKKTKPPQRYTEGSLVARLEKLGIGRPSTYASILQNIISRAYITVGSPDGCGKQKNQLFATELGMVLVQALKPGRFMDYQFTNHLEKQLDDIAEGKADYMPVVRELYATVERDMAAFDFDLVKSPTASTSSFQTGECPKCGEPLKRLPSKSKRGTFFWVHQTENAACEKYLGDKGGKPVLQETTQRPEANCPSCGQTVRRLASKQRKGEFFWVHLEESSSCSKFLPDENGKPGQRRSAKTA